MVDEDLNEAKTETWSAPTHADSDYKGDNGCFRLVTTDSSSEELTVPSPDTWSYALGGDIFNTFSAGARSTFEGHMEPILEHTHYDHTPSEVNSSPSVVQTLPSISARTLVDVALNEVMAESWSGPTRAGSICGPGVYTFIASEIGSSDCPSMTTDQEFEPPKISTTKAFELPNLLQEKPTAGRRLSSPTEQLESEDKDFMRRTTENDESWTMARLNSLDKHRSLELYLGEDPSEAPWTMYHLKVSLHQQAYMDLTKRSVRLLGLFVPFVALVSPEWITCRRPLITLARCISRHTRCQLDTFIEYYTPRDL
jgi:hypothetical protein